MKEVHLLNLIEMYNIIMTSFNKLKFKYLIQVWEDAIKIIKNMKNVNVEKILWWRHHLNIPPPPYVTISHHFRVPNSPGDDLFWTTPNLLEVNKNASIPTTVYISVHYCLKKSQFRIRFAPCNAKATCAKQITLHMRQRKCRHR